MSRYELLERIGVGGMAEIFRGRATAVGGFEKPVAIKKILPHLRQDNQFVRMLIAEAKILATFRQRNIVQIYDVGLGEDGEYFLVMEYVEGCDLGALYDRMEDQRARFPVDLALHIGSEVCDALDHAHRATDPDGRAISLVHRDVSPSNVLLSYSGEVKLTDFGIAKKTENQASVVQSIAGKFAYMSPEQARAAPLDGKSDIYSLGVILYELLLGRRLYSGANEFEALRLVREARVPRPRDVDPSFSRDLEALLMKALHADPKQRYPTAAAFAAALRDYRYSASTSAGDPSKEITSLVRRYFPPKQPLDRNGAPEAPPKVAGVVRIQTVAGFTDGEGADGQGHRIFDSFDAPTRAVGDDTNGALALGGGGIAPVVAPASRRPPRDEDATGARPLDAAGFDAERPGGDEAETRLIDTRATANQPRANRARVPVGPPARPSGKEPTPTVRDLPIGSLFDELESTGTAIAAVGGTPVPMPVTDLLTAPRRRAVIWAAALLVTAALLAFVIAGYLMAGADDDDTKKGSKPSVSPAGEALEGPSIKAPVKRKHR